MPSAAATPRDLLMPQPADAVGRGLAFALLAHVLLVIALAFGVNWRSRSDAGLEAELWAAVPVAAAPRAVEPEPKPVVKAPEPPPKPEPRPAPQPDAQIAIEKAKREEARREQELREQAEREKKEAAAKKAQEEKDKRAAAAAAEAQRQKNLERMLGQAGATGEANARGSAAQSAGPSAGYAGRIRARIKPNIVFPDSFEGNPLASVEVKVAPDGTIVGRRLVKSSGVAAWDEAVLRAIDKTEVLPRDTDGRVPPAMLIEFRPRD